MTRALRRAVVLVGIVTRVHLCLGQGLSPRAYVITPVHSNAVTLTDSYQQGNIVFDPTLPLTDTHGRINTEIFSYFHTLNILGRSANVDVSLPYASGRFQGTLNGIEGEIYRSGLAPAIFRISANLKGGPAMTLREFAKWRQGTLLGVSFTVDMQTGQYDPARLINIGANRWAFKPEFGFSQRRGKWLVDAYAAAWFFTPNSNYYSNAPGTVAPNRQTQEPMGAVETHLSYDIKPRMWVSIDGNYWYGGETKVNGVPSPTTLQASSRLGATAAIPFGKHQSIKFSYSNGTYVRFGGDYQDISVGWQYSWLGRPN